MQGTILDSLKRIPVRIWLLYTAIIMVTALIGFRSWQINETYKVARMPLAENYIGPADADKVIVQFLDYRCSFCRKVHPAVEEFSTRNPDVKIVNRYIMAFQKMSLLEANMAVAASMQGQDKFIRMHNYLATNQKPVGTKVEAARIAKTMGLDVAKFNEDLYGAPAGDYHIMTINIAELLGINSTPTFLINKSILVPDGEIPTAEDFEDAIKKVYGDK